MFEWQMLFNIEKCVYIYIGHLNRYYDYYIGENLLRSVDMEQDLDIQSLETMHCCKSSTGNLEKFEPPSKKEKKDVQVLFAEEEQVVVLAWKKMVKKKRQDLFKRARMTERERNLYYTLCVGITLVPTVTNTEKYAEEEKLECMKYLERNLLTNGVLDDAVLVGVGAMVDIEDFNLLKNLEISLLVEAKVTYKNSPGRRIGHPQTSSADDKPFDTTDNLELDEKYLSLFSTKPDYESYKSELKGLLQKQEIAVSITNLLKIIENLCLYFLWICCAT
ncbi:hypothetical protein GQR58_024902 [Nymphon striatum]|nr:hypothetical protein GQR58_024902 [Nymphon striatum]